MHTHRKASGMRRCRSAGVLSMPKTLVKMRRTITVEYLYSDDPHTQDENRWDELTDATDAEVIKMDQGMNLAQFFRSTEFTDKEDTIEVLDRTVVSDE